VGQKRLHPTSVGANGAGGGGGLPAAKRPHTGPNHHHHQQQQQQRGPGGRIAAGWAGGGRSGGWVLPLPGVPAKFTLQLATVLVKSTDPVMQQEQEQPFVLLVENSRGGGSSSSSGGRGGGAEVSLHLGGIPGHICWQDKLPEQVSCAVCFAGCMVGFCVSAWQLDFVPSAVTKALAADACPYSPLPAAPTAKSSSSCSRQVWRLLKRAVT
jgi:hypothetical protein